MRSETVGLIGYGSSVYEKTATRSEQGYMALAARAALDSAGLSPRDIDGISVSSTTLPPDNAVTLAEHFGLSPRWTSMGNAGGAGSVINVMDAVQAVESGRASCVLCLAGAAQDTEFFKDRINRFNRSVADYLAPHGFGGMNGLFGIIMRKHMETYGTRRESLGRISVDQRANAGQNDNALLRKPMTLEEYLNAPLIADPIRLFDCVLPCAGAEALIVAPLDRAQPGKGVRVVAAAERHNHPVGEVSPLRGGWETFREGFYDEAGFGPEDVQFIQAYDDYPIMVAVQIEDLGFCPKGEIGGFLDAHSLRWDGDLPLNTGGGQLSCGQTGGGGGMIGITEAVRQLRGEGGGRQVPGARRGLVSGYGMVGYGHGLSASAMMLEAVA
ncbi:thiolase family protein [Salipiger abyssi]|uniref:thiolase family protein n=1 Tax=Salipiger abyssi TaxID=1250539 RepID=UPI001A8FC032|nr:thiolase family protein [Salipiger abyssi]MBN9885860.1 thiolase family protein [Salipiger abyssi]